MNSPIDLSALDADQLRALAAQLMTQVAEKDHEIRFKDARNAQLTHEIAVLKRLKFAARSEKYDLEQQSLLDETVDGDIAAIEIELAALSSQPKTEAEASKPRRAPLPTNLPRVEIRHEPESTSCKCGCELKRIGEDISEKLDYTPGVFTVERHVRGKWVCAQCETLIQAPVPAQIIDKGIPTAGLLAQVLVSKYGDHLPLYRQERIFERAGFAIPRSTLGQWIGECGVQLQPLVDALKDQILTHTVLHADETPVAMLSPGKGKTQRAYIWTYTPGAFEDLKAVIYDFADTRAGEHARAFLGTWQGKLVCDDYTGYKRSFAQGVIELGCMAHYPEPSFMLSDATSRQYSSVDRKSEHWINLVCSKGLQKREHIAPWFPCLRVHRLNARSLPECKHRFPLCLKVSRDVATGRRDASVTQVVTDNRHIGPGLQKRNGATVTQDVRSDVLAA